VVIVEAGEGGVRIRTRHEPCRGAEPAANVRNARSDPQLLLDAVCLVDLLRDDRRVRGGNKGLWAVAILFLQYVGPIAYLLVGRIEE